MSNAFHQALGDANQVRCHEIEPVQARNVGSNSRLETGVATVIAGLGSERVRRCNGRVSIVQM
jgi:hypothetical protein